VFVKIVLKNPEPFRVYHHSCDVVICSKQKKVEIFDSGTSVETFDLIEKNIEWVIDDQNDTEELLLTISVT